MRKMKTDVKFKVYKAKYWLALYSAVILLAIAISKKKILKLVLVIVMLAMTTYCCKYFEIRQILNKSGSLLSYNNTDDYEISLGVRKFGEKDWHYDEPLQVNPGDTLEVMTSYKNIGEQAQYACVAYDLPENSGLVYDTDSGMLKNGSNPEGILVHHDLTKTALHVGSYSPNAKFFSKMTVEVPEDLCNGADKRDILINHEQLATWVGVDRGAEWQWLAAVVDVTVVPRNLPIAILRSMIPGNLSEVVIFVLFTIAFWICLLCVTTNLHECLAIDTEVRNGKTYTVLSAVFSTTK